MIGPGWRQGEMALRSSPTSRTARGMKSGARSGTENEGEVLLWRTLNPQPEPWASLWNPAWAGR